MIIGSVRMSGDSYRFKFYIIHIFIIHYITNDNILIIDMKEISFLNTRHYLYLSIDFNVIFTKG